MEKNLLLIPFQDDGLKKSLYALIAKKRKSLLLITKRYEKLEEEINDIQSEYELKVSSLFRKDRILEAEISRYRRINELMRMGLSYEDAIMAVNGEEKHKYSAKNGEKAWEYLENPEALEDDNKKELRVLWKKLVQKYHPDLAKSEDEREKKEELMKYINNAYAQKDYDALKVIEKEHLIENVKESSIETLEKMIADLESAIIHFKKKYLQLKKNEWFAWLKKPKKEKEQLFFDLQRGILREVLRKEMLLTRLRKNKW